MFVLGMSAVVLANEAHERRKSVSLTRFFHAGELDQMRRVPLASGVLLGLFRQRNPCVPEEEIELGELIERNEVRATCVGDLPRLIRQRKPYEHDN